jgi:hypothetical protein
LMLTRRTRQSSEVRPGSAFLCPKWQMEYLDRREQKQRKQSEAAGIGRDHQDDNAAWNEMLRCTADLA